MEEFGQLRPQDLTPDEEVAVLAEAVACRKGMANEPQGDLEAS